MLCQTIAIEKNMPKLEDEINKFEKELDTRKGN
jgi:hypothetical protein